MVLASEKTRQERRRQPKEGIGCLEAFGRILSEMALL
jgi:hypothetical protein